MKETIKINKKYLTFREQARDIFKRVKSKDVCLDFKETAFFSRSFGDELLNMIEKKKTVKIINLKPDLKKLLSIIKKTRKEIYEV